MRAYLNIIVSFTCVVVAGGCSSSSNATVADVGTDASVDTGSAGDTGAGDTKPKTDAKPDTRPPTPDAGPACDPIKQTGCSGTTTKCTAIDDGTGTSVVAGCMAPSGSAAVAASCTRKSETPAGIGDDTCAPGAYCSGIGTLTDPPTRHCRKFCLGDSECGTGEKCSTLIPVASGVGPFGICVPTCTVFGTDCATGMNCSLLISDTDTKTLYGTCRAIGTGAAGSTCKNGPECAADLDCADPTSSGSATCVPLCDSSHACTGGTTCKPAGSLPSGGGLCQ
jgi:hypothetical protein